MKLTPARPVGQPLREWACRPTELIDATETEVRQRLGEPDTRRPGRYWSDPARPLPGTVERRPDGNLYSIAVFGPVPLRIPPGTPYRIWSYRNVQGVTWLLCFAGPPAGGPRRLVEVASYPEGAVF